MNKTTSYSQGDETSEMTVPWRRVLTIAVMAVVTFGLARSGATLLLRAGDLGPSDGTVTLGGTAAR